MNVIVSQSVNLVGAATAPPRARRQAVVEVVHGVELTDPYRWLEDQDSPETRAWVEAQNSYTESVLRALPGVEATSRRIAELTKLDWTSAPTVRGNRYFLYRRAGDQEQHAYYVREGLGGEDRVLLDPHTMSDDLSVTVQVADVSEDGSLVVYGLREGGEDELTPRMLEVDSGKHLPDALPKARYMGLTLTHDNRTIYYCKHGVEGSRVYRHTVGADPRSDELVFGEGLDPGLGVGIDISDDGRWLLISVWHGAGGKKSEVYLKDLAADGPIVTVVNDLDATFSASVAGGKLYLTTDWEAPNRRLLVTDVESPGRANWHVLVPEREHALESVSPVGGRLFLSYVENVVPRIVVCEPDATEVGAITGPGLGSVSGMAGRWDQDEAFYSFSSFHIPPTIYRYSVATGKTAVWSQVDAPVDSDDFEVKQSWFVSKDGTRVPMFVCHKKGLVQDGSAPALLGGYGGFQTTLTAGFNANAVVWMERGGVFAVANLRGGGEFGEKWHEDGMLFAKRNTFDDFIAAAEHLIAEGYTRPERLAIEGGSNGGLLVGAAMTQRPDLFAAVCCGYPLLDMVRYHKFLLAKFWVPEYGSAEDPEQFRYLLGYSPYHNVRHGVNYPAVLFTTGDADTRVHPLHARKMCALMQEATGSGRPVLLRYDTKLGHSGGRPVNKQIEDQTLKMSFLMWQLGMPTEENHAHASL